MTVYSGVLRHERNIRAPEARAIAPELPRKINTGLLSIAILVILAYIMLSNVLVSQKYLLNSLKTEFNRESAQSVNINSRPDIGSLIDFAENAGMIGAKDTAMILIDSAFAFDSQ